MLATNTVSPDIVFEMLFSYQQSAALKAALDLDVFTAIDEGTSDASALATRVEASARGVRILCDYLTTFGLLSKTDNRYSLSPTAAAFLTRKSPTYIGSVAQFLTLPDLKKNFDDLTGAVRRGGVLPAGNTVKTENPIWVEFAHAMVPMAAANAQAMAQAIEVPQRDCRVLDIAAGHGMYGIVLAQRHPRLHVTAVDWAPVLRVASDHAKRAGVESRYELRPGDAFTTALGSEYDLALVTNFLHHFSAAQNAAFLRRVADALSPNGQVALVEFVPNADRVSPVMAARFSLTALAETPEGDAYTLDELTQMLADAGFDNVRTHALPTPQTLVVATKR